MIAEFLITLVPVALAIWGIHILFQEGHLLEDWGNEIENRLGKKWSKPVVHCPVCMSSLWGAIGFFSAYYFFGIHLPWRHLIPFLVCLCGLNTIISKLINKERIIVDQ